MNQRTLAFAGLRLTATRSLRTSCTTLAKKNPYTDTLLLPKTPFPLRANAATREHLFRDRCTKELYPWQLENNPKDLFILHDGPPYANGDVHLGHALNKILKDIINRYKMLQGHKVWYRPGWDCHGLPIELKALEAIRQKGSELSATEIRQLARKRALSEIEKQKKSFKSWSVMGDWNKPYRTLDKDYEIRQLRVFREMMKRGYIYRQLKPVYWSPSSKSALAEAELEYNDKHVSRSIHVRFPVAELPAAFKEKHQLNGPVYAVIWTTTPWTLPANKAVAVHPELTYSIVRVRNNQNNEESQYIIGKDRLEAFSTEINAEIIETVVDEIQGKDLVGTTYTHPLWNTPMSIIGGDHVTAESGTGLVHTAPGHGMEDYEACQSLGIDPFSPVDDEGRFTHEAGPELEGMVAFDEGTDAIIKALTDASVLVHECEYVHKYPYDWRTKKPVMLRSTAQWFANVEDLQKNAVRALQTVRMVPDVSLRRLEQFTVSRKEWCISRQRSWGVPIPALYDTESGEALLTDTSVEHIIRVFEDRGIDAWWEEKDDSVFVAPEYRNTGKQYRRGYDTMDVWFDSGTSWTMIESRGEDRPLADVYLEGSDQHRGWFQSSLLTSIAVTGKQPYGTLITHGFTLDEEGRKMSKSIGNTIAPSVITHGDDKNKKLFPAYGTDVLRMWVANCEYTKDIAVGPSIIAQVSDIIRKIRTTARFLLGNLHDFSYNDCVPYDQLKETDRYMLHELFEFGERVTNAYDNFAFNRATHHIQHFTTNNLSAFYFDVVKDRLYNNKNDALSRRTAQTVLYHVLRAYTASIAPVACHTAEEIYESYRSITPHPESSVFKQGWLPLESTWHQKPLESKWAVLKQLKSEVNQVLEVARQEKVLRSSQEADVDILVDPKSTVGEMIHTMDSEELASFFLTSRVKLHEHAGTAVSSVYERDTQLGTDQTACKIVARPSTQHKCPRCWNYHADAADTLCSRCANVLNVASA
ncbi:isoleucyl-tRNA synthetase [Zychaea mexicana]|uniref:isoleucyl-tRNA synthetase n=1 Tax=Zychaea mexicana TaxID=64656 RepID=UPI0022FE1DD1|nr:isoleucyl-tRNA synthetase [Zychaea mexicana]KAI9492549.1 isoleucyl-tRNA synthetase [Zychaea mexicana]